MANRINTENLTPTQQKVKKARPVIYDGPRKNTEPDLAVDILSLYITCRLGYSAIRHIIGHDNDHKVEDVVRQHMLGRKDVEGEIGELNCPGRTTIEEDFVPVIRRLVHKYGTMDDPYVIGMFAKGKWHDDPAYAKKVKVCPRCGKDLQDDWKVCPYCGRSKEGEKQKALF